MFRRPGGRLRPLTFVLWSTPPPEGAPEVSQGLALQFTRLLVGAAVQPHTGAIRSPAGGLLGVQVCIATSFQAESLRAGPPCSLPSCSHLGGHFQSS